MTHSETANPRVGYVMTHYPKLAQTFIANEIVAVERAGIEISRFAMNPPTPDELEVAGAREKASETVYLKPRVTRGLTTLLLLTVRHPLGMASIWRTVIASAGGSLGRLARRVSHLAQAALVADHARRQSIEHLHAHFGLAPATIAWFATAIARARGNEDARFSFTIHGFHDFVDAAESRLDLKVRDCSNVLCISDFTRSQLCMVSSPTEWDKFTVARCGIDLARFAYRDPPPLPPTPTLLAVGRLSPEKGFGILVQAVSLLAKSGRDVKLRIVGEGPARSELATTIDKLGLADQVELAGEQPPETVLEELQAADLFCMSSFNEGLPISLMEAMAVGVPVVTTWIAGIPEIAKDGETATTVPPADAQALADGIATALGGRDERKAIARAARAKVERQHDLQSCGETVAQMFRDHMR